MLHIPFSQHKITVSGYTVCCIVTAVQASTRTRQIRKRKGQESHDTSEKAQKCIYLMAIV